MHKWNVSIWSLGFLVLQEKIQDSQSNWDTDSGDQCGGAPVETIHPPIVVLIAEPGFDVVRPDGFRQLHVGESCQSLLDLHIWLGFQKPEFGCSDFLAYESFIYADVGQRPEREVSSDQSASWICWKPRQTLLEVAVACSIWTSFCHRRFFLQVNQDFSLRHLTNVFFISSVQEMVALVFHHLLDVEEDWT